MIRRVGGVPVGVTVGAGHAVSPWAYTDCATVQVTTVSINGRSGSSVSSIGSRRARSDSHAVLAGVGVRKSIATALKT